MIPNDFVRGVIKGIEIAQRLSHEVHDSEAARRNLSTGKFDKDTAQIFWATMNGVYYGFTHGNRAAAIERLRACIEKHRAEVAKHGNGNH